MAHCENKSLPCQTLLDAIPNPIFYKDTQGRFLGCNTAFATFLKIRRQEIIGKTVFEIAPPDKAATYHAKDEELLRKPGNQEYEHSIVDSDGQRHHVLFNKTTFLQKDGSLGGIIGIITDITERKKTEEFLASQSSFLQTIVSSLPYPFYVIDVRDYSIVLANSVLCPDQNWEGITCHQLTHHSNTPCGGGNHICPLQEVLRTGKPVITEHVHYNAQGNERFVEVSGYPVFNDQGKVIQLIEYSKDITDLKKAEQEQAILEQKLRQAHKMEAIGTLAGGIAHDFNNILTAIIGYADMVKDELPGGSQAVQDLDQVLKAGKRAKDLVQHILQFSRQEEREYGPMQIHLIVKEVLKLLRAAIPANIEIRQSIDPQCGSILSEPTEIHQIVMNLCTNATHAMEHKDGILEVRLRAVTLSREDTEGHPGIEPGPYVLLSVTDSGTGIDPLIVSRIFDPYFTTKIQGEGTGMGLAVIHGIVKNHGGTITVQSTIGRGSTFHVYLPKVAMDSTPDSTTDDDYPRGNEKILLVDDEKVVADMEHRMLEGLGYHVESRVSSIEALQAFRDDPMKFDLVLTDQTMPQMTGVELAKQILAIRADIPIILCTGFSKHINEENAKAFGIREYIMKPLLKKDLARCIKRVLDNNLTE